MKITYKVALTVVLGVVFIGGMYFLGQGRNPVESVKTETTQSEEVVVTETKTEVVSTTNTEPKQLEKVTNEIMSNRIATITTNKGVIKIELFEDTMPITTANFIKLVESGFYNDTKFHRVIPNFMIQGGDPNTKTDNVNTYGMGGPGYAIADEHVAGELLTNTRGTISMANSGPQSGGSQFFINVADNIFLDFDKQPFNSKHPVFGRIVAGMDIADAIVGVQTTTNDRPIDPVIVESVTIGAQ